MLGKILSQIAIGVGIDVVGRKVLPQVAKKAKEKLQEMKQKQAEEEQEGPKEETLKAKVYSAEWR